MSLPIEQAGWKISTFAKEIRALIKQLPQQQQGGAQYRLENWLRGEMHGGANQLWPQQAEILWSGDTKRWHGEPEQLRMRAVDSCITSMTDLIRSIVWSENEVEIRMLKKLLDLPAMYLQFFLNHGVISAQDVRITLDNMMQEAQESEQSLTGAHQINYQSNLNAAGQDEITVLLYGKWMSEFRRTYPAEKCLAVSITCGADQKYTVAYTHIPAPLDTATRQTLKTEEDAYWQDMERLGRAVMSRDI